MSQTTRTNDIGTIPIAEFIQLKKNQALTIVDVRTPAEVNNECLMGCHNLPLQQLDELSFNNLLDQENIQTPTSVYLLCGTGMRAKKAAEKLSAINTMKLCVVEGGISALKAEGEKIQQGGGKTISLERQVRISAGTLVVVGIILGAVINPALYGVSAFVGAGLVFAGVTDSCGMAMVLARMPWNKA